MIRFKQLFYESLFELIKKIQNAQTLEEAEEYISKDGWWSYKYAKDVIKGRFEKGEEAIARDSYEDNNLIDDYLYGVLLKYGLEEAANEFYKKYG